MILNHRKVDYYNITVQGDVAEGSKLLTTIAEAGVDFLVLATLGE